MPDTVLAPLVDALREVVAFAGTVGELRRDVEASAVWREVYPALSEGESGMVGAILNRAEAQVLRLSALYAVLDRSSVIRAAHLQAALALWDYADWSARRIFGRRLGVPLADVLLKALRAQGPLTATAISGLFGRHRSAEEIHQALDLLRDLGLVARHVEASGGRIDVLVNNAGGDIGPAGATGPGGGRPRNNDGVFISVEDLRAVIDRNLISCICVCREVAPEMIERRSGRIVNLGSVAGLNGRAEGVIYATAKAAVHECTRCLAVQLRGPTTSRSTAWRRAGR